MKRVPGILTTRQNTNKNGISVAAILTSLIKKKKATFPVNILQTA